MEVQSTIASGLERVFVILLGVFMAVLVICGFVVAFMPSTHEAVAQDVTASVQQADIDWKPEWNARVHTDPISRAIITRFYYARESSSKANTKPFTDYVFNVQAETRSFLDIDSEYGFKIYVETNSFKDPTEFVIRHEGLEVEHGDGWIKLTRKEE